MKIDFETKIDNKVIVLILILIFASGIFYCFIDDGINNLTKDSLTEIYLNTVQKASIYNIPDSNLLKIVNCEFDLKFDYWNFTDKNLDYRDDVKWEQDINNRRSDFYITCREAGTGNWLNVYLFKNYQLFFKREEIYRGRSFRDVKKNLYIIEGEYGDANCCPSGYILTKLKYNSKENKMDIVDTKNYPAYEIKILNSTITRYYNKELYDFEKNKSIDIDKNDEFWGDWFNWSSIR